MRNTETSVDRHYGRGAILDNILLGLEAAGKDVSAITVDDLAPIDAFHTRGREATDELIGHANLTGSPHVLDVGCGLGGTARHLAAAHGCRVTGIDLTEEYIDVAGTLSDRVGLGNQLTFHRGSALELPFEDESFDLGWTEHVQMNIPDKDRFYAEIARVLAPGGRLLFHDILRGDGAEPTYPVPWAETAEISALGTTPAMQSSMTRAGFEIERWDDKRDDSLRYFDFVLAHVSEHGLPPTGIHLLMGDTAETKLRNYVANLSDGRIDVVMGVLRKI